MSKAYCLVALAMYLILKPSAYVVDEPVPIIEEAPIVEEAPTLIDLGEFKVTAYCTCVECCGIWSQDHPSRQGTGYVQKTKSGTIPQAGRTIAVDTSVIPLGTTIVIDGHEYVAEDTGSAIKGKKIDMYFDSHTEARIWGVKSKNIYLKGE